MTQDEIIDKDEILKMAKQAGAIPIHKKPKDVALVGMENINAFVKLVAAQAAAKEREACANTCEKWNTRFTEGQQAVFSQVAQDCANAIRARGETTLRGEAT
jgi:hypothetical protein